MKILLLGSGAREHALARCLASDPSTTELVAVPGNPGITTVTLPTGTATTIKADPTSAEDVVPLARDAGGPCRHRP